MLENEAVKLVLLIGGAMLLTYLNVAVYRLQGGWRQVGILIRDTFGFLEAPAYVFIGSASALIALRCAFGYDAPIVLRLLVIVLGAFGGFMLYWEVHRHMRATFAS